MRSDDDNPFWTFSIDVYGRPGTAAACLALQDRHGVDVNMLLACCWLGAAGVRLDQRGAARLMAAATPWHELTVRPLRELRRRLRSPVGALPDGPREAFRDRIKALELDAERAEQDVLYDVARTLPAAEDAGGTADPVAAAVRARDNVAVWSRVAGHAWSPWDMDDLGAVLTGAFPGADGAALAGPLAGPLAGRRDEWVLR